MLILSILVSLAYADFNPITPNTQKDSFEFIKKSGKGCQLLYLVFATPTGQKDGYAFGVCVKEETSPYTKDTFCELESIRPDYQPPGTVYPLSPSSEQNAQAGYARKGKCDKKLVLELFPQSWMYFGGRGEEIGEGYTLQYSIITDKFKVWDEIQKRREAGKAK